MVEDRLVEEMLASDVQLVCGPWSATFPSMMKYFVEKLNTMNNETFNDLLIISILFSLKERD